MRHSRAITRPRTAQELEENVLGFWLDVLIAVLSLITRFKSG